MSVNFLKIWTSIWASISRNHPLIRRVTTRYAHGGGGVQVRELKRLKRTRDEREAREAEKAKIERRKNMTIEEVE